MLSFITFLPLLAAMIILFTPKEREIFIRVIATLFSAIVLFLSIWLLLNFNTKTNQMQFVEQFSWIPAFNIKYFMGIDGLSLPLIMLTGLLSLLSIIYSYNINTRVKEYFFFLLILETGMLGVFVSLDLFLFYIFWEIMLVPMYFLIGIWGGPRKEYAAIKFFLYTLFGSVIMLLAILGLYFYSTPHTFNIMELINQNKDFSFKCQSIIFVALYVGFAIKIPAFPFHTWLPDAHVEAPTAISVILAGVLLKMGIYGLLRTSFPILPDAAKYFIIPFAVIGVINVVYGALVSMAQKDLKKMIAYSSISHMGYCMLGMASLNIIGFNGAVLQMVTHGIITGSLFLLVGVLYDRTHIRDIDGFGGLGVKLPIYTGIMITTSMASLGLPGLAGFVSEFMCFLGMFMSNKIIAVIAVTGVVITAGFFLIMIRKIFLGPLNTKWENLKDMSARELIAIIPLVILMIVIGVYPNPILKLMDTTLTSLIYVITK
ncbi:MAG: NADH-quinone oxidoreductase subunit M [Elusimicrobia bacterium]|nr:NADH-quinone oxidoreductase subunit M [Elusimicrobiota bacterium]